MNNWDRHFRRIIQKTTAMIRANRRKHGEQDDRRNVISITSDAGRNVQ